MSGDNASRRDPFEEDDETTTNMADPAPATATTTSTKTSSAVMSSAEASRAASPSRRQPVPREKKRVGFTGGGSAEDSGEGSRRVSYVSPFDGTQSPIDEGNTPSGSNTPYLSRTNSGEVMLLPQSISRSHLPELSPQQTRDIHRAFEESLPRRPRPAIRQSGRATGLQKPADEEEEVDEGPDETGQRALRQARAREAFERGKRLEEDERSVPTSRYNSPDRRGGRGERGGGGEGMEAIPLEDFSRRGKRTGDEEDSGSEEEDLMMPALRRARTLAHKEAATLVQRHGFARTDAAIPVVEHTPPGARSGAVTPTEEQQYAHDYRPKPEQYRGGILGALLKLYKEHDEGSGARSPSTPGGGGSGAMRRKRQSYFEDVNSANATPQQSPPDSGAVTPTGEGPGGGGGSGGGHGWFGRNRHHKNHSTTSLAQLIGTSSSLGSPMVSGLGEQVTQRLREQKAEKERLDYSKRSSSATALAALNRVARGKKRLEDEIKITVHIAETIARQRYLMRLCRALMMYGAPTHRLEEYMRMSARVLEIDAQFLYIPGSMIMSFDDPATHTTEVKLVRVAQGLDLGRLRDVHETYKDVVHDQVGVEEATIRLKDIMSAPPKHSRLVRIPVYGLAAVCVAPFAFDARLIDLPISFILGCILGVLQLVVAPASDLYNNVFEVSAAVITSFLSRAFGSIPYKGGYLFCFSALASSSIALILPGFIVLCASLELQSKSIVAGSVRMVYAIIYSLFLGYGITIGSAIYGIIDSNASSEETCSDPMPGLWKFFFVPGFTMCLIIVNQGKWRQAPIMLIISFAGYLVNYFTSKRFTGNTQVSQTLGALAIGVMANLYSRVGSRVENWTLDRWERDLRPHWRRFRKRVFGANIARSHRTPQKLEDGSLRSDGESAYEGHKRRVGYSLAAAAMLPAIFVQVPSGLAVQGSLISGIAAANVISGESTSSNGTSVVNSTSVYSDLNSTAFSVSYSVIQIAIGITVGLFLSAIVVYPFGKRRSGLFSF